MRGAPRGLVVLGRHLGIIPACAGSTTRASSCGSRYRDHPRLCGEHRRSSDTARDPAGSSPLVRGALQQLVDGREARRIIPACAGSTSSHSTPSVRWQDYPRLCGEHLSHEYTGLAWLGSSPLVRGALTTGINSTGVVGIIPACAGSTRVPTTSPRARRDHPRLCGEHAVCDAQE